jgi:hypothetical protein
MTHMPRTLVLLALLVAGCGTRSALLPVGGSGETGGVIDGRARETGGLDAHGVCTGTTASAVVNGSTWTLSSVKGAEVPMSCCYAPQIEFETPASSGSGTVKLVVRLTLPATLIHNDAGFPMTLDLSKLVAGMLKVECFLETCPTPQTCKVEGQLSSASGDRFAGWASVDAFLSPGAHLSFCFDAKRQGTSAGSLSSAVVYASAVTIR